MHTPPRGPSMAPLPAHVPAHRSARFPSRSRLFGALDLEWQRLATCPRAIRRAASWELGTATPISTLDDVLVATGLGRPGDDEVAADGVLRRLVELAADDDLAARVVLQRIVPGLRNLPFRRRAPGKPITDLDGEVVGAAWTIIRTFPVETRGHHLAAQLLRDVEYRVFRLPSRRLAVFIPCAAPAFERPGAEPERPAAEELGQLLADARRAGLPADDLLLLCRLAGGATTGELAVEQSVTDRMIRYRRAAAIDRVRELVLA